MVRHTTLSHYGYGNQDRVFRPHVTLSLVSPTNDLNELRTRVFDFVKQQKASFTDETLLSLLPADHQVGRFFQCVFLPVDQTNPANSWLSSMREEAVIKFQPDVVEEHINQLLLCC